MEGVGSKLKNVLTLIVAVMILSLLTSCQNMAGANNALDNIRDVVTGSSLDDVIGIGDTKDSIVYPEEPFLDLDLELMIREDFWRIFGDVPYAEASFELEESIIGLYLGNYSGSEVVGMCMPRRAVTAGPYCATIAGYNIQLPSQSVLFFAYKDSYFYNLGEAYDAGWITRTDVYNIGKQLIGSSFMEQYPEL